MMKKLGFVLCLLAVALGCYLIFGHGSHGYKTSSPYTEPRPAGFDLAAARAQLRQSNQLASAERMIAKLRMKQVIAFFSREQAFHRRYGHYSVHLLADFGLDDTRYTVKDISTDGQKLIVDVRPSDRLSGYLERLYMPYRFSFKGKYYLLNSPYAGMNGEMTYVDATPLIRAVIDHGALRIHSS